MFQDMSEMRFHTIRKWLEARHVGQAFQPAIQWPGIRPFTKADLPAVQYYKRRLPHWELGGSTYFLTFRVNNRQENPLANHELASIFEEILWFGPQDYPFSSMVTIHCKGRLESLPQVWNPTQPL
jgi:hypothetical protein